MGWLKISAIPSCGLEMCDLCVSIPLAAASRQAVLSEGPCWSMNWIGLTFSAPGYSAWMAWAMNAPTARRIRRTLSERSTLAASTRRNGRPRDGKKQVRGERWGCLGR